MELHFILNGKPVEALIKADTILLDLLRDRDVTVLNVVVIQPTVVSAQYCWKKNRFYPVRCWRHE